ncbi:hypothetical protein ACHQM5_003233 [Ranunculus cassubicifolius]
MALKLTFVFLLLAISLFSANSSPHFDITALADTGRGTGGLPTCNGLVGECIDQEEETMIDSDHARRSLFNRNQRYISYAAMRKNSIPCNRRGRSYYRCGGSNKVNPYTRGCSAITHCRRNLG